MNRTPHVLIAALVCASVALTAAPAAATAFNPIDPLGRVYSIYHDVVTDHFMTQSAAEADFARGMGFVDDGEVFYVERTPQTNTVPLRRFYKWLPERDHFYTSRPADADSAIVYGYTDEGVLGYVYTSQVPGSVPLYRLFKSFPANDVVHRYTVSAARRAQLLAQGFVDEGIEGYVYLTPVPTVAGGHIFGRRQDDARCGTAETYRDCYFGSFRTESGPPRPKGATRQVIRFTYWSPNFKDSGEHIIVTPRGLLKPNVANLERSELNGIGLIIGAGDYGCGPRGAPTPNRTFIEQWWPEVGPVVNWNSYNYTTYSGPDTCGQNDLGDNTPYDVIVSVDDAGLATYTVMVGGMWVIASGSVRYNGMPWKRWMPDFDRAVTSYFLAHAHSSSRDYTAYLTNITVTWE